MMFASIARTVVAHPWHVIATWVVAAIAVILFAPSLDDYTTGNQQTFLPSSFESSEAQAVGNEYFPSLSGATAAWWWSAPTPPRCHPPTSRRH